MKNCQFCQRSEFPVVSGEGSGGDDMVICQHCVSGALQQDRRPKLWLWTATAPDGEATSGELTVGSDEDDPAAYVRSQVQRSGLSAVEAEPKTPLVEGSVLSRLDAGTCVTCGRTDATEYFGHSAQVICHACLLWCEDLLRSEGIIMQVNDMQVDDTGFEDMPVVRFINRVLLEVVKSNADALEFTVAPGDEHAHVVYVTGGDRKIVHNPPAGLYHEILHRLMDMRDPRRHRPTQVGAPGEILLRTSDSQMFRFYVDVGMTEVGNMARLTWETVPNLIVEH